MLYSIKNFIKSNTGLLIRMDDIAEHMNWKLMNKCETLFDKYNIRPLLGVIPNNQDEKLHIYEKKENFWDKVRLWQEKGWEISMHGFSHVYDTETKKKDYFNYGGRSEFFGHDYETQLSKIRKGLEKFGKIIQDAGYVATIRRSRGQDIFGACGQLRTESQKSKAV